MSEGEQRPILIEPAGEFEPGWRYCITRISHKEQKNSLPYSSAIALKPSEMPSTWISHENLSVVESCALPVAWQRRQRMVSVQRSRSVITWVCAECAGVQSNQELQLLEHGECNRSCIAHMLCEKRRPHNDSTEHCGHAINYRETHLLRPGVVARGFLHGIDIENKP